MRYLPFAISLTDAMLIFTDHSKVGHAVVLHDTAVEGRSVDQPTAAIRYDRRSATVDD